MDFLAYDKISYFIALLIYGIHDINEEKKGLKENKTLYGGLKMSYISLSFYERKINNIITFPSFTSCSIEENVAKIFSGRTKDYYYKDLFLPIEKRQKDKLFSVLLIIDYKYNDGWEPIASNISSLSINKDEEEYIFPPFNFFKITKVDINLELYEAEIYLETIGKKNILEKFIRRNNIIRYNKKDNTMEEKIDQEEYEERINKILEEKYPFLTFNIDS